MHYDVIVVGAGPAGASAAEECAKEGISVALVEKDKQPGTKVCAGGLEYKVLREFSIDEDAIQCHTNKYRFYAPSGKRSFIQEVKSATTYRKDFDRYLVHRAVSAGALLLTSTRCQAVVKNREKVVGIVAETPQGSRKLHGDIVVAADGFRSVTALSAGLQERYHPSDFGVAIQCETRTRFEIADDTKHIFYGRDLSPCGFGWIYPKKHGYTVGLGSLASRLQKGMLSRNLKYLMKVHPIGSEILSKVTRTSKIQAACIPLKPSSRTYSDGILVAGDAAGQVSPLGGNGIYYAMKAGTLAGKVAVEAVTKADVSEYQLQKYEGAYDPAFGDEFRKQRRILRMMQGNYNIYMEAKILVKNHPIVETIYNRGLEFAMQARMIFKRCSKPLRV